MTKLTVEREGKPRKVFMAYYIVSIDSDTTLAECRKIEEESPWSDFYYKEVLPLMHKDFGDDLTVYGVDVYIDGDGSWVPGHAGSGSMALYFEVCVGKNKARHKRGG